MMRQVFSNAFVLFGNCEQDEEGINYNFWIYPQHQVNMRPSARRNSEAFVGSRN